MLVMPAAESEVDEAEDDGVPDAFRYIPKEVLEQLESDYHSLAQGRMASKERTEH